MELKQPPPFQPRDPFWLKGEDLQLVASTPFWQEETSAPAFSTRPLSLPLFHPLYLGALFFFGKSHSTMERSLTHTGVTQRLLRSNHPTHTVMSQQNWQDFMATRFQESRTMTTNYPLTGTGLPLSQPPSSPPYYSPTAVPSMGGFETSRIRESLERIWDHPHPNFGIPPFSTISPTPDFVLQSCPNVPDMPGFGIEKSQAVGPNRVGPHLLDSPCSGDPPKLHFLVTAALSSNHHLMFDTASCVSPSPLDILEFQLPQTSTSSNNSPSPFNVSPFSDPPEVDLLTTATSPSSDHLFGVLPPADHSPFDASPSGNTFEFDLMAALPTSSGRPSPPPDASQSSDSPDHLFRETSYTQSEPHGPVYAEGGLNLMGDQELPSSPTVAPVPADPEYPQGIDKKDPQSALRTMNDCGRGVYECLWSYGGDGVCGFRGQVTHVRRHVARVHFEIKCVQELFIINGIDLKSPIESSNARNARRASSENLTSGFT